MSKLQAKIRAEKAANKDSKVNKNKNKTKAESGKKTKPAHEEKTKPVVAATEAAPKKEVKERTCKDERVELIRKALMEKGVDAEIKLVNGSRRLQLDFSDKDRIQIKFKESEGNILVKKTFRRGERTSLTERFSPDHMEELNATLEKVKSA